MLDDGRYDNEFQIAGSNFKPPARRLIEPDEELDHDEVQPTRRIFIKQKESRRVFDAIAAANPAPEADGFE